MEKTAAATLAWGRHTLELGGRTLIMGILNATPDSFSDGSKFEKFDDALRQAERLIAEGADILDIGGESTRPYADPVPTDLEIERTAPVIERLAANHAIPVSIDTTKAAVARAALQAGASIINDISALRQEPELGTVAAEAGVPLILMHMQGTPRTMQKSPTYENVVGEVREFLEDAVERAMTHGVDRSKIIIDPGFGFGKTVQHNFTLLKNLPALARLGLPILAGVSRKSFIRRTLADSADHDLPPNSPTVAAGTQAAVAAAIMGGAHIVRVHDVTATRVTVRMFDAMRAAPDDGNEQ
ncbi:MAG: dihydropteroate synthase [Desulfosudaceae bacterium]